MFNRWFLAAVIIATLGGLALAIYLDSSKMPAENGSALKDEPTGTAISGSNEQPAKTTKTDDQRLNYVISVLDTLEAVRSRLPYYGELILSYSEVGNYSEAAAWAERRAHQTGQFSDATHAASLYFAAINQKNDEESTKETAYKAKEMYIMALELRPDDPDILTDLAVVYLSLLQPERSYKMLKMALEADPDHIRANFNSGVLLHQIGNISESIPFFDRSLVLAENSEWESVVQEYLDRHHNEIYH